MKNFIQELHRRNVIKSALAYLVIAWLITQVLAITIPAFEWPKSLLRTSIIILVLGFPFWLIFSWSYEITPEGLKQTKSVLPEESITGKTSNRLNYIIIAGLIIAIGLLIRSNIYSTAKAVNDQDLASITVEKSIAVLAFADMSPEKDQEYFSDGISEEILNLLTKIPELKVISRTSSFSYKGKDIHIKKIGKELNVSYVLEGSIRKSGNTFRITAQLIDAITGVHMWSETYDRSMEDIFKVQDEIATRVAQQLKTSLIESKLLSRAVNIDAYNLYLQVGKLYSQNTTESNTHAIKLIKESIAIDSTYAPVWSGLSDLYYSAGLVYVSMPMDEALKQGRAAATKAIDLDSNYVSGYLSLASIETASWNFKAASRLLEKATLLEPNNVEVLSARAGFVLNSGKPKEAIALLLQIKELDPVQKAHYFYLGLYYWMLGELAKAEESLDHLLVFYPDVNGVNGMMGNVQLSLGHPQKALDYIEKDSGPFWNLYRKSMAVYAMGNIPEADMLLKQLITNWGDKTWPNIADVYAYRGEKDNAFKWLELALENKDSSLLEILNYPAMQNLWGDPRWNEFINKLPLPDDHGFHLD